MGEVERIGPVDGARRIAQALRRDPREVAGYLREAAVGYRERAPSHLPDPDWEPRLHALLGAPWPCPDASAWKASWEQAVTCSQHAGIRLGRHTYGGYSDGDPALTRAVWCGVRHLRPRVVVETGVAHGVTSRVILDGLDANGAGRLCSIDLPHLFRPELHAQTAVAVPPEHRQRWTYLRGSSRRRLPALLDELGEAGVFVHDSLHTARNVRFELVRAAEALPPGGLILVDDISTHQAFEEFALARPEFETLIAPSEDGEGLFGVAVRRRGPSR